MRTSAVENPAAGLRRPPRASPNGQSLPLGSTGSANGGPFLVRLRGVSPEIIGRARWWRAVAQVACQAIVRRGRAPEGLTWRKTLGLLRHGFLPYAYELYNLGENRWDEYLSDRDRERTWKINWPAATLLDDKIAFSFMLQSLGVPTPPILAVVRGGRVFPVDGASGANGWFRDELDTRGRLVVKPARGGGGNGILMVGAEEGRYTLNAEPVPWTVIADRIAALDYYIVTPFVEHGSYSRALFPRTSNSIRVVTIHPGEGEPFIACAVHRIGTNRSVPVDNRLQGGVAARIDLETGVLGPAVAFRYTGNIRWHETHPDTGASIAGTAIPNWPVVRAGMIELARRASFVPYVGWDLVVTDDGFEVLEGNKFSAVALLQAHQPLLRDPRVRAFFRENGIVA